MKDSKEESYSIFLNSLKDMSVGLVYSFAPKKTLKAIWYDKWQTDVISSYGRAIECLGASPFYIDVDTFCRLAFSDSLPILNCIFNLNAGITPISNWALVPSVACWKRIPIIPCDADTIILGERKDLSFLLAKNSGFQIPRTYDSQSSVGQGNIIVKPRDLGGSVGIKIINLREQIDLEEHGKYIYQEFIPGFDLTVPVLFNPITDKLFAFPGILYLPECEEPWNWIHSEQSKIDFKGYKKVTVELPDTFKYSILKLAVDFGIDSYCRFDFRVKSENMVDVEMLFNDEMKLYFMEINPMPTLRFGINYLQGIKAIKANMEMYKTYSIFYETMQNTNRDISDLAFVLSCAIFTKLKSKSYE